MASHKNKHTGNHIFISVSALVAMLLIIYGLSLLFTAVVDKFFIIENTAEALSQASAAPAVALKATAIIIFGVCVALLTRSYVKKAPK